MKTINPQLNEDPADGRSEENARPHRRKTGLLITGLPGVPGYNAFYYFKKVWPTSVFGLKPSHQMNLTDETLFGVNAEETDKLEGILEKFAIGTILDASGCCALRSCEHNPEMAELINVKFGKALADKARKAGARLIRLSSDMVFAGRPEGLYRETDPTSPITVYGKSMVKSELQILETYPEALILRISLPMGPSLSGHAGAVDWIRFRFHRGLPATLYYDEIRSPFYVQDLLRAVACLFESKISGIFHLGGSQTVSLYQIAQIVNILGGYNPELLHGCYRLEAGPVPPRVGNVSMDCSSLAALLPENTLRPWPLKKDHFPTSRQWHWERNGETGGSIERDLYGYGPPDTPEHPEKYFTPQLLLPPKVRLPLTR